MNTIVITTECVADLPAECPYSDIDLIYYDIQTEEGLFRDNKEIISDNVLEYMMGGHKLAKSVIPTAMDYRHYFEKLLKEYDEILHICVSSSISEAYKNANLAKVKMGREGAKVTIVDSRQLSTGLAMEVLRAAKLRAEGKSVEQIEEALAAFIPTISTTFLSYNADYLYYNGKVGKNVMKFCHAMNIHPLLAIIDGKLELKRVYIGKYRKCVKRYVKHCIGKNSKVSTETGFITYAGCSEDLLNHVKDELASQITFETFYENQASATVSCNCGPNTVGVIYAKEVTA